MSAHAPLRCGAFGRSELRAYFESAWDLNERLFATLSSDDALYIAPDPLRNPLIFYLGHTAAFYINKLRLGGVLAQGIDDELERVFAKGVDPEQPEELNAAFRWPEADRARAFRERTHEVVTRVIDSIEIPASLEPSHPLWALLMALEHARIHFETSSVLFRQLDLCHLQAPEHWKMAPTFGEPEPARFIEVPAGQVRLGRPKLSMFAWDNELGRLDVQVAPFVAADRLVTNHELLQFVADGGYEREALWSEAGWRWRSAVGARAPQFLRPVAHGFRYRAMFQEMGVPLDWPAEVNAHEAIAFCRWRGPEFRLLTEAEHRRIADEAHFVHDDCVFSDRYNLALAYGSPAPVTHRERGRTPRGFYDPHGNVWQWLADDFRPLPGFSPHRLYEDFSAPYFDSEHAMLLGGSWASTGTSASRYYRLWFRRKFFQHAGFRLAKDR